jgi:hypothetical protein
MFGASVVGIAIAKVDGSVSQLMTCKSRGLSDVTALTSTPQVVDELNSYVFHIFTGNIRLIEVFL